MMDEWSCTSCSLIINNSRNVMFLLRSVSVQKEGGYRWSSLSKGSQHRRYMHTFLSQIIVCDDHFFFSFKKINRS